MPRTDDNVLGAEGGGGTDRSTTLNPDQLDLQYITPKMETTTLLGTTGPDN